MGSGAASYALAAQAHKANGCLTRVRPHASSPFALASQTSAECGLGDSSGYCAAHRAGSATMREPGRKGGQARTRSVLGLDPSVADDNLRAKARRKLDAMLDSDNPQHVLRAAQSLS